MDNLPDRYGQPWTRDELVVAFDLYCRIPFNATKASNPDVRQLAVLLRRSPASVARKLGNFGAFDPALSARGISGLIHASKLDRVIWDEFHRDWPNLVACAHDLRTQLENQRPVPDTLAAPSGPSEKIVQARQRLHQSFFRQAVLSSYGCRCCITGIPIVQTLVASHIIPWSKEESLRANPTNGLCLSATFDRLFDAGLMTLEENMHVVFSRDISRRDEKPIAELIERHQGKPIILPDRFLPSFRCLQWHRENVFRN